MSFPALAAAFLQLANPVTDNPAIELASAQPADYFSILRKLQLDSGINTPESHIPAVPVAAQSINRIGGIDTSVFSDGVITPAEISSTARSKFAGQNPETNRNNFNLTMDWMTICVSTPQGQNPGNAPALIESYTPC